MQAHYLYLPWDTESAGMPDTGAALQLPGGHTLLVTKVLREIVVGRLIRNRDQKTLKEDETYGHDAS